MLSRKVSNISAFQDPASGLWNDIQGIKVDMMPAPIGLQPNDYITEKWENRDYGQVGPVSIASVHDGSKIAFLLKWKTAVPELGAGETFSDSAAIAMPVRGEPSLFDMGTRDEPIHILHWLARNDEGRSVTASGIGTSSEHPSVSVKASGQWSNGYWAVVFVRDLVGQDGAAQLTAGAKTSIGIAIWNGKNQERAGIKAISEDWSVLGLEA